MCGITGIYYNNINNACQIYQSLLSIQHRGQDGAGIYWCNNTENDIIKKNGLIGNTFNYEMLKNMKGNIYIAHNRYKTNNVFESFQPFFLSNDKIKISLCHNGNIINVDELLYIIKNTYKKNIDLISDSYVLTVYIFEFLNLISKDSELTFDHIIELSYNLQKKVNGSFSILLCIQNFGLIAIRDKNGIRPLSYGINTNGDYLISSETCSFNHTDFTYIDEIENGETILFNGEKHHYKYCNHIRKEYYLEPCLFEYIYFSRVDSIFNKISVYKFRYLLGQLLGKYCSSLNIDYIVPTPETSRIYAYGLSNVLKLPIQEAIILNRYINRTFICDDKKNINQKIKQKFSVIKELVEGKNLLVIDDSIVRGNTSKGIVELLKNKGANKIYFASAAPKIYNSNNFGIFIEKKEELATFKNKTNEELSKFLGVEDVFYNNLNDVLDIVKKLNPSIENMEISMFID